MIFPAGPRKRDTGVILFIKSLANVFASAEVDHFMILYPKKRRLPENYATVIL